MARNRRRRTRNVDADLAAMLEANEFIEYTPARRERLIALIFLREPVALTGPTEMRALDILRGWPQPLAATLRDPA